jgi:hypothetical protein
MTASRKMMVSPLSRIVRAISLGVFCRLAPSTSAIMRSRKVLPCSAVMRTTMRSLSTRVPPVTALRSPPLSRITGADSPVMADSSTLAMPSTTSPSPGMTSPASQTTRSPTAQVGGRHLLLLAAAVAPISRRATISVRARRSAVGLGLAAAFGQGLGEVGEEHREPEPQGDLDVEGQSGRVARRQVAPAMTVVISAPTATTNMTGFLSCWRGSSLRTSRQRPPHDGWVEQGACLRLRRLHHP